MQEGAEVPRGREAMTRIRWAIVGMAFLGTTINYVDRANLAVAAPFISDEPNLGSFQMGLILSGFFWTYAVGQLLAGYLVDRYGARIMYTFSAVWWSVFTAAAALAQGFALRLQAAARHRGISRLPKQRQGDRRVVPETGARAC